MLLILANDEANDQSLSGVEVYRWPLPADRHFKSKEARKALLHHFEESVQIAWDNLPRDGQEGDADG